MLPVAAQWFLLSLPRGESLVPMVQVALTLPMALLAIPAGVLADRVDRRRLVIAVQLAVVFVQASLVVLAVTGELRPWSLLGLVAVLACGIAATFTSLSSMVPDLVRPEAIPAAAALMTIATNATRVIGPALAGVILAVSSAGTAFAAAIPATLLLLVVLVRMSPLPVPDRVDEGWLSAARGGLRFVRHSPQAMKLLVRAFWFTSGIMGLFSLVPVLAIRLGATSGQLGIVLAMQGLGAVLGAVTLRWLGGSAPSNWVVAIGFVVAGGALTLAAGATTLVTLSLASVVAGWAWTTVLATVQAGMQTYLPAWVRARGLSVLMVATFTGQALGAYVSGWVAEALSSTWALVIDSVLLVGGGLLAVVIPLRDLHDLDRSAVRGWVSSDFVVAPNEMQRQLQVRVQYDVVPGGEADFLETMNSLRLIRLRTGAHRWQLLESAEVPGRFHEEFMVGSWNELEQQVQARSVVSDRAVEARAAGLSVEGPSVHYSLRVDVTR